MYSNLKYDTETPIFNTNHHKTCASCQFVLIINAQFANYLDKWMRFSVYWPLPCTSSLHSRFSTTSTPSPSTDCSKLCRAIIYSWPIWYCKQKNYDNDKDITIIYMKVVFVINCAVCSDCISYVICIYLHYTILNNCDTDIQCRLNKITQSNYVYLHN